MRIAGAAAGAALGLSMSLAACGPSPEEKMEQNAAVQNFVPPFVMSRLDFGGVLERRFRRLDRNGDDRLVRNELPPRRADWLMRLDRNDDGAISNEEWSSGMLARFDTQDLNRDGTVTSDERERARAMNQEDLPTPADEPVTNVADAADNTSD